MNKKIFLDKVLEYLTYNTGIAIPDKLFEKIELWEELVGKVELDNIPDNVLDNEDKFLRLELINRKLTDGEKLRTIDNTLNSKIKYSNKLALWNGDITTIYADVVVNSITDDRLNDSLNDNDTLNDTIFIRGGMRLRKKCKEVMKGVELGTTEVLVTRAYNIPSDFIIHVVAPQIENELLESQKVELEMCYYNILECARNNMAKVIVLPCIGTGVNKFPKEEAAEIAIKSVQKFLDKYNAEINKIVFDVYDEESFDIYNTLLSGE